MLNIALPYTKRPCLVQEADLPGSGYTSGIAGCGLGVLLDAAIPQTKALAGELRRKYFHRLPDIPGRKLGSTSTLLIYFLSFFVYSFLQTRWFDVLVPVGDGVPWRASWQGCGQDLWHNYFVYTSCKPFLCDWLSRHAKWMTCEYGFGWLAIVLVHCEWPSWLSPDGSMLCFEILQQSF